MIQQGEFKIKPFSLGLPLLLTILIFGILLGVMYWSTLNTLIFKDWSSDDYSHCILIPFIVAYLMWEKHHQLSQYKSKPSMNGFYFLFTGIFLYWLGELAGEYFTIYISLWVVVVSLCIFSMGWAKTRVIIFPLLFSLTMFPFPSFINSRITLQLKLISSRLGVLMMQTYGMSAFREGNVIDLGFTKLQVVDACSGLRYLFPMIVLSILISYYYRTKVWKRAIIIMSAVPLTIFSNSIRIALTGILSEKFGQQAVEGFFHDFEGILIFLLTLVVLLLEIWVLKRIFPDKKVQEKSGDDPDKEFDLNIPDPIEKKIFFKRPQFILPTILLLMCIGISQVVEFREAIAMNKPFSEFPMKVGKWGGTRQEMEDKFIDTLDFTDYVMVDYRDDSGKTVNFYVAYYASQRKGESIHSPASCLRGGGWKFKEAGGSVMELKDKTKLPFNRAVIVKEPVQQISYYWFPSRDRVLTNAYQLKWFNFWDALTRQRTDGALVRVITVVYPDEDVKAAEDRMKNFIRDVYPVLSEFLPK